MEISITIAPASVGDVMVAQLQGLIGSFSGFRLATYFSPEILQGRIVCHNDSKTKRLSCFVHLPAAK